MNQILPIVNDVKGHSIMRNQCCTIANECQRYVFLGDIQNVPILCVLPLLGSLTNFASMGGSKDIPPLTLKVGNQKKNMFWKVFRWVGLGFGD